MSGLLFVLGVSVFSGALTLMLSTVAFWARLRAPERRELLINGAWICAAGAVLLLLASTGRVP